MRPYVRRLCVGAGARPFNKWDSSLTTETPPEDIVVYIEWVINGVSFTLFKYIRGLNAIVIKNTDGSSYMVFNDDIRRDFILVRYFEDEYNNLISYTVGD